jgi:hypothetical protein
MVRGKGLIRSLFSSMIKDVIIHKSGRALLIYGQGSGSVGRCGFRGNGAGAVRTDGAGGQAVHRVLCRQYQESEHPPGLFPCGSGVLELV